MDFNMKFDDRATIQHKVMAIRDHHWDFDNHLLRRLFANVTNERLSSHAIDSYTFSRQNERESK
jgi:hypothetical protein